jgi:YihY family inner membrane protein
LTETILKRAALFIPRLFSFLWRVLKRFFGPNKGFLLAGAVGYSALLSFVPLFALSLIALSNLFSEEQILSALTHELGLIAPGQEATIVATISEFMDGRATVSGIGLGVMLFFSSIAFRILSDALAVIFKGHKRHETRHAVVNALMPYVFVGLMGVGLLALTVLTGVLAALEERTIQIGEFVWSTGALEAWLLWAASFGGLVIALTSIYVVMPTAQVRLKRALVGGLIAAILWEIVRNTLSWYFTTISLVNVVYGSIGAVIIVLLSMEFAAAIILLGAQVIAEIEQSADLEIPWWVDPVAEEANRKLSAGPTAEFLESLTPERARELLEEVADSDIGALTTPSTPAADEPPMAADEAS